MNAFTGQTFQMNQILNLKDVMQITRLGRATIYNMRDPKKLVMILRFLNKLSCLQIEWVGCRDQYMD
jgi:hypothetical protein